MSYSSSSSSEIKSSSSTEVESTSSVSSSSQSSDNEFIPVLILPAYYINSEDPNPILISEQERVDLSAIGVLDSNGEINTADFDNDQKTVVSYLAQREYWKKVKAGTFSNANNLTDAEIDVIIADMNDLLNIEIQSSSSSGTVGETGFDDDNFDVSSGSSASLDSFTSETGD